MPVKDASREAQVIVSAVRAGEARGVQYSPLAMWGRVGKAPDHTPVDLANTIRPLFDSSVGLVTTNALPSLKYRGEW